MAAPRPERPTRGAYAVYRLITTRWMDNDVYGHVNNVFYYSFFDTAVNGWLVEAGLLEIQRSQVIGLVVATECSYFAPIAFPDAIEAGIAVERIGTSSVTYGVGIFRAGEPAAAAAGRFTHVYVGAGDHRPVSLPAPLRTALKGLMMASRA